MTSSRLSPPSNKRIGNRNHSSETPLLHHHAEGCFIIHDPGTIPEIREFNRKKGENSQFFVAGAGISHQIEQIEFSGQEPCSLSTSVNGGGEPPVLPAQGAKESR